MTAQLWSTAVSNAFNSTIDGSVTSTDTSINLISVTNLPSTGGILVIDRQSAGTDTPSKREYVSYTGVSGTAITGVTRGIAGSTAQSHTSGALVEETWTTTHWRDAISYLQTEHDSTGKHILSTATINYAEVKNLAVSSIASIAAAYINNATITNLSPVTLFYARNSQVVWSWAGSLPTVLTSNATHFPLARASRNWTISSAFVALLSAPSTGVLTTDINYLSSPTASPTSIFGTHPTIDVGEYDTSTAATAATLALTSLASGVFLEPEIETPNGAGELMISLILQERP